MSQQHQGKLFPQVPEELRSEYASQQCPYCLGLTGDFAGVYYIQCVCQPGNRVYPYTPIAWCWDPKTDSLYHPNPPRCSREPVTEEKESTPPPKPSESPSHDPSREPWNATEWELKYLDSLDTEINKIVRRLVANGFKSTDRLREYVRDFLVDYVPGSGDTSRKYVRDIAIRRITHDYPRNTVILQKGDTPNPLNPDDPFIGFSSVRDAPRNAEYTPGHEPIHSLGPDETPEWELDITLFTTEELEFIAAAEEQQICEPTQGWTEHLTSRRCYALVDAGFSINAVAKRLGLPWKKAKALYESVVTIILESDLVIHSLKIDDPSKIVTPTEAERDALSITPLEHDSNDSHISRVLTYCCETKDEKRAFQEYITTGVFRQSLRPVAERATELLQQNALVVDEDQPLAVA